MNFISVLRVELCLFWSLSVLIQEAMSLVSNARMSWQEAVGFCSRKGMIMGKNRLDLVEVESENFWTRIYKKEHFVYLMDVEPNLCQSCAKVCSFENCSEPKRVMCETLPETVNKPTAITEYRTTDIIPLHTINTSGHTKYATPHQTTRKTTQPTTIHWTTRYNGQVSNQTVDTSIDLNATDRTTVGTNESILNGSALIYCVSSLLSCILIFGIVCLLYMRRKRNRRRKEIFAPQTVREELYELADNSQLENADNGQVQANNGLCTNDSTTPGSVHREDIYNHLWEKTTDPNQDEESVYNRCIEGTDDNTYDVSFRKKFQFPSRDSVYHHVTMCDTSNG